jgi:uncharacterized repeat protein (TIGR03803 family)
MYFRAAIIAAVAMTALCGEASAYTYKVIYNFCAKRNCTDGSAPQSSLLMDSAGNFYGTTGTLSTVTGGSVFKLDFDAAEGRWKLTTLHHFSYNGTPTGGVIIDVAGDLYGVTSPTDASVFELLPNSDASKYTYRQLYAFDSQSSPFAGLTYQGAETGVPYDGISPLYGAVPYDQYGHGYIYQLSLDGDAWSAVAVYSFCSLANCMDGKGPISRPIFDSEGNLYGTTFSGGQPGRGVLFELAKTGGSWNETVLHSFCTQPKCRDGLESHGGLIADASGTLYGTDAYGGGGKKACCGAVYKLVPDGASSQYSLLYDFCHVSDCKDGANPQSELMLDSAGTLYGTTETGGGGNFDINHQGGGTVFALNGESLQVLHAFCAKPDCLDGEYPLGGVVMDSQGNLFGTTSQGGKYGEGVVFELSP